MVLYRYNYTTGLKRWLFLPIHIKILMMIQIFFKYLAVNWFSSEIYSIYFK